MDYPKDQMDLADLQDVRQAMQDGEALMGRLMERFRTIDLEFSQIARTLEAGDPGVIIPEMDEAVCSALREIHKRLVLLMYEAGVSAGSVGVAGDLISVVMDSVNALTQEEQDADRPNDSSEGDGSGSTDERSEGEGAGGDSQP
jgi:hypothetical protein